MAMFRLRNKPQHSELADLVDFVARPKRVAGDYLELALSWLDSESKTCLLWLKDPAKKQYILQHVVGPTLADPPVVRWVPFQGDGSEFSVSAASWIDQSRLRQEFPHGHTENLFALAPGRDSQGGVLQLLSGAALPADTVAAMQRLSRLLASHLDRVHRARHNEPLFSVGEYLNVSETSASTWFRVAAEQIRSATNARACAVFVPGGDGMRLHYLDYPKEDMAALPSTLVADFASLTTYVTGQGQGAVRVRDFGDAKEREQVFGTVDFDQKLVDVCEEVLGDKLTSLLGCPVVVDDHGIGLFWIIQADSIGQQFTPLDETIVERICGLLQRAIPGAEIYRGITKFVGIDLGSLFADHEGDQAIFADLTDVLPGTLAAAIELGLDESSSMKTFVPLGGSTECFDSPAYSRISSVDGISIEEAEGGVWFARIPLTQVKPPNRGVFVLVLRRGYLLGYEKKVLESIATELGQEAERQLQERHQMSTTIEIRHAIRSGLAGVQHLDVARRSYDLYEKDGNTDWLTAAAFRKAIDRSYMYLHKTQGLLEASRFLLDRISATDLRVGEHSITQLVRQVAIALRPEAERRSIEVDVQNEVEPRHDHIVFDRELVDMAVFNLLENAIKYSYRDRRVTVTTRVRAGEILVVVKNLGVPITPEDKPGIFMPFHRKIAYPHQSHRPGTGLGLAVAQEIVSAHRGSIDCESREIDSGRSEPLARTTFTLRFPRAK